MAAHPPLGTKLLGRLAADPSRFRPLFTVLLSKAGQAGKGGWGLRGGTTRQDIDELTSQVRQLHQDGFIILSEISVNLF